MHLTRSLAVIFVGTFALLAGVPAHAQSFTWDPLHNTTGSDGAGSWDTNTLNWASSGADILWPNTASVATFGAGQGAAGIITLSSTTVITNGGITFNPPASGNYIVSNGSMYLAGPTPTITVVGSNATILSAVQGASGLTTAGNATLVLAASNSYSGPTTIGQTSTLQLTSNNFPFVQPVLYMNFNNLSGTTVANQGSGGATMNGTLTGNAVISTGSGMFGHNALSIPGGAQTAGYLLINNPVVPLSRTSTWTVGMWVKSSTIGGCTAYQGSGSWAAGNVTFYFGNGAQAGTGGTHQGAVCNSSGWEEGTATTGNNGAWNFITMVNNGGTFTFYLNGTNDPPITGFSGTGEGVGSQFWLGGSPDTGDGDVNLNGLISDVWIYNVALNAAQVQTIMNSSSGPAVGAPVLPAGTGISVAGGATLDLNGHSATVSTLNGAGTVDSTTGGGLLFITNQSGAFSGTLSNGVGGLGLTMSSGTLTLNGVNTYQGATTLSNGTLNLTGSLESSNAATAILSIGANSTSPAVVNFSGAFLTNYEAQIGAAANSFGALFQTAGILNLTAAAAGTDFQIGNAAGAFGYYYIGAAGTAYCNEIGVAGEGNAVNGLGGANGNGLMDVYGTVHDNGWLVMARTGSTQDAILNVYPGATLLYSTNSGGGLVVNWGTGQTSVVNILGGSVLNNGSNPNQPVNLMDAGNASNLGVLNLNSGGVLEAGYIQASSATGKSIFNFNGGTLLANENQGVMFATALTAVKVYSGGGTINNNGFVITCGDAFTPPSGNGVYGFTITNNGAGYLTPPIVLITNGTGDTTGVGATAIAQVDTSVGGPTSGQLTNILITSPGYNYTAAPGFSLIGGNPATAAGVAGVAPSPNSASGSLVFSGTGKTVISSGPASTTPLYISAGTTLEMNNNVPSNLSLSSITVSNGGTFNLLTSVNNVLSNSIVLQGGSTFGVSPIGPGSIATPVSIPDGAVFSVYGAPGAVWTVPGTLTLGTTTGATVNLAASSGATAPLVIGTLALQGVTTVNLSGSIGVGGTYPFLTYTNLTGSGALAFVLPGGVTATVITNVVGGVTTLSVGSVTGVSSLTWVGSVNGTWDFTTPNWTGSSLFKQGGFVVFDDTAQTFLVTNVSGTVAPSAIVFNNSANSYVLGNNIVIAGATGLTKNGSANVTIAEQNTYTGPTVINSGQVIVGAGTLANASSPLGLNSTVSLANTSGAALNLNNNSTQVGSLAGGGAAGGNVILGSGTLTMGADNSAQSFAGVVSGTGGLAETGNGVETLTGVNTFTGGISGIASTAALVIGGAGELNNGAYAGGIANSGLFEYNSSASQTLTSVISGTGSVQANGTGILTLNALSTFTGNILVNGATVIDLEARNTANPTTSGLGNPLAAGRVVTVTNGGLLTFSGSGGNDLGNGGTTPLLAFNIGPGSVVQNTSGNVQMGPITLNGGTLLSSGTSSTEYEPFCLSAINSGGTVPSLMTSLNPSLNTEGINLGINLGNLAQMTFNVAPTGTGAPDLNVAEEMGDTGNQTANFNGFILTGGGTLALTAPNFFRGPITITSGTLMLANNNGFTIANPSTSIPATSGNLGGVLASYAGNIIDNSNFVDVSSTAQTLTGTISGTGTLSVGLSNGVVIPGASLTLTSPSSYSGATVVAGPSTLFLSSNATVASSSSLTVSNGGILDITGLTSGIYTMGASQNLLGGTGGYINGSTNTVVTGQSSKIFPGTDGTVGTLTFPGGLTMSAGSSMNFDLSSTYNGANDQVILSGSLPLKVNYNSFHIKAPSTGVGLDQTADYILVTNTGSGTIIGNPFLSAPTFDVAPTNANHFTVVTEANSVVLHYNTAALPGVSGSSTTPSGNLVRNQTVLLSVTVVQGSNPITNVWLNLAPLGGLASNVMTLSGTANVYTNTITIPPATLPGVVALVVEAEDNQGIIGGGAATIPVVASVETWTGGAPAASENFDSNTNWLSNLAPGYVGDSLVFMSNLTAGLNVNLDNNYSVNYLWFSNNAPAFVIGTSDASGLTLNGSITNTSTNAQTLNVGITLTAPATFSSTGNGQTILSQGLTNNGYAITNLGSGTNSIAGINDLASGGTLTQAGAGQLNLSGNNSYTGQTTVNLGELNITGTIAQASAANMIVGGAAGNATLLVGPGAAITNDEMFVGNLSNAVGAVYQTGGYVGTLLGGVEPFCIGNVQGSFGYYDAAGGTNAGPGVAIGGEGGATGLFQISGNGILDVKGGTINNTGWIVMNRGTASQASVLNMYSGSLTYNGGGLSCNWANSTQSSTINVMGGSLTAIGYESLNLNESGGSTDAGILNLIGGACQPAYVVGAGQLNFNGGTIMPSMPVTSASFISGPTCYLYATGGTLNNNGFDFTDAASIIPAFGNGISVPTITSGGTGYIAPPIVLVTNASGDTTGFGATVIAQINPTTGKVTNVLVTCPGQNYSKIPVFTLSGGGASAQAVLTGNALVANTGAGIMTFDGTNGETYLSGGSSYTNLTIVTNGTLGLVPGGSLASSEIYVAHGATFDTASGFPNGYQFPTNQILAGLGTLQGATNTLSAGDIMAPGPIGGYGTLSINGNLVMGIGSTASFHLTMYDDNDTGSVATNDLVSAGGTVIFNGNSIHISAPSTTVPLDTGDYTLLNASGGTIGVPNSVPVWDIQPPNSQDYNLEVNGASLVLHYSTYTRPNASATASPNPAFAGQTITVTVNATNGSAGSVSGVTVDFTPLGGGLVNMTLKTAGNPSVWTASYAVPLTAAPIAVALPVLISDAQFNQGSGTAIPVSLFVTIATGNFTWNGGGANENWDNNANWVGGLFPPYFGNDVTFAGTVGLTPVLDNNWTLAGLAFAPGAGAFSLTNSGANALTLQAGSTVTNNSSNVQTFNLPFLLGGSVTFNAAANNMVFPLPNLGEVNPGTSTFVSGGSASNIMTGNAASYAGNLAVNSGSLVLANSSVLGGGDYLGNIAIGNGGTLIINSTNNMTFGGTISGSGALEVIGVNVTNTVVTLANSNTLTGPLIVNGATVIDTVAEAYGAPVGTGLGYSAVARTVTITNGGVVSLNTPGGNFDGYGTVNPLLSFNVGPGSTLVTSNGNNQMGPITLNGGTLLSAVTTGNQYDTFELESITTGPAAPSLINTLNPGTSTGGINLTINQAAGTQFIFNVVPSQGGTLGGGTNPDLTVVPIMVNSGGSQNSVGFTLIGGGMMAIDNTNIFSGSVILSNGIVRLNAGENAPSGGPLGATNNVISMYGGILQYSATNQYDYSGRFNTGAGQLYYIDTANQNNNVVFASPLVSSGGALTKLGLGQLELTATNTYTGATTVSNGILVLGGTGSIANTSAINISGGGTLDVSAISTYTLPASVRLTASGNTNHAVLAATTFIDNGPITLNYNGSQPALNLSKGTLILTNKNAFTVNGSVLGVGTYTLIQASSAITSSGVYTVSGTAISPSVTATVTVSGNNVILNVSLTTPPTMTFNITGGNTLNISWPSAYLGASLLYQSNSLSTGLQTNASAWLVYPGSTAVTSEAITIGKTNEVFFQLLYP